jgi:hypothetical protein
VTNPATEESERTTSFDLVLPPDPELLRVVRLVASGLASLTALDLDAVEEIRVGADELVATLIQASDGSPVTLTFALTSSSGVTISGSTRAAGAGEWVLDPLTERILSEVATSHEGRVDGDQVLGRIDHLVPEGR